MRPDAGPVETRVLRNATVVFSVGAVVFGGLSAGTIIDQTRVAPLWWTLIGLGGVVALSMIAAPAAFLLRPRATRVLLGVIAVLSLVAHAAAPIGLAGLLPADGPPPWTMEVMALGTVAAAAAWRPSAAWAVVVATIPLLLVGRIVASGQGVALQAVQETAYGALFSAICTLVTTATLSTAARIDTADDAARRARFDAAGAEARRTERRRVDALVHDRVLSTLIVAARRASPPDRLAAEARRALEQLAAHAADAPPIAVPPEELVRRLRADTTALAADAEFGSTVGADAPTVPAHTADALAAALGEALRNSLRHAGPANRTVHVDAGRGIVRVDVIDDGSGFDPEAVPPDRLGIAVSIIERMRAVPGGEARIVSRRGVGTRVAIRCRPCAD